MRVGSIRIDKIKLCVEMAKNDFSGKELSKRSGVSVMTISYIKNGKTCSVSTGAKLATALGVDISDLVQK